MEKKYKTINQKLKKHKHPLVNVTGTSTPCCKQSNVTVTADELTLLNKSLKYNLSYKQKEWIKNLGNRGRNRHH